jgi:hypothetical protein
MGIPVYWALNVPAPSESTLKPTLKQTRPTSSSIRRHPHTHRRPLYSEIVRQPPDNEGSVTSFFPRRQVQPVQSQEMESGQGGERLGLSSGRSPRYGLVPNRPREEIDNHSVVAGGNEDLGTSGVGDWDDIEDDSRQAGVRETSDGPQPGSHEYYHNQLMELEQQNRRRREMAINAAVRNDPIVRNDNPADSRQAGVMEPSDGPQPGSREYYMNQLRDLGRQTLRRPGMATIGAGRNDPVDGDHNQADSRQVDVRETSDGPQPGSREYYENQLMELERQNRRRPGMATIGADWNDPIVRDDNPADSRQADVRETLYHPPLGGRLIYPRGGAMSLREHQEELMLLEQANRRGLLHARSMAAAGTTDSAPFDSTAASRDDSVNFSNTDPTETATLPVGPVLDDSRTGVDLAEFFSWMSSPTESTSPTTTTSSPNQRFVQRSPEPIPLSESSNEGTMLEDEEDDSEPELSDMLRRLSNRRMEESMEESYRRHMGEGRRREDYWDPFISVAELEEQDDEEPEEAELDDYRREYEMRRRHGALQDGEEFI